MTRDIGMAGAALRQLSVCLCVWCRTRCFVVERGRRHVLNIAPSLFGLLVATVFGITGDLNSHRLHILLHVLCLVVFCIVWPFGS